MNKNLTKNLFKFSRSLLCTCLLVLFSFWTNNTQAQTVLIDSTTDGAFALGSTFAANGWTVANYGLSVNQWVVGTSTTTGMTAPFAGNKAYISNDGGLTNNYDVTSTNHVYFYKDITIPAGAAYIPVSFTWLGLGEASWDLIQVFIAPTTVTPTGGVHPGSGTAGPIPADIAGATQIGFVQQLGTPQIARLVIPSSFAGTTVRLIFMWKSDTSIGTAPAGSVDNISVISYPTAPLSTATSLGGLWSSPATWVGGVVPGTGVDVSIPTGSVVIVDQVVSVNNLTIDGKLEWNATANALTAYGNITISSTGKFLPYTTATGGTTGVTVNVGGTFTNNGYANLAVGTTTVTFLNFNGPSGGTLTGTGTFEGDGTRGIIRQLFFQSLGSSTISTTQNLTTYSFAHTAGSINTGGRLRIDNTAQIFGRPINTQVANVPVTAMGSLYNAAPVVFGAGVTQWSAITGTLNVLYVSGTNVYRCTAAASIGVTPPTHTSGITNNLLWIGTTGTLGNPFLGAQAHVLGTQYFYGGNLYVCTVAGTASTTAPPVHTSGSAVSGGATFLYVGTPAQVSVNYDATTQTVRSLNLVSGGSGYSSAVAPTLVFSVGIFGGTGSGAAATPVILYNLLGTANSLTQRSGVSTISGGLVINSDQGASVASADPQASSGVGNISTANGGVNYTVAPTVGFAGPTALNLITNPGSGYTVAPTITVSGGLLVSGAALTTLNFTITVNQGMVQSVYLNAGTTACYLTPPTLTLTTSPGVTATLAFPSGCWPAATANIGTNGQITSFTVTNPGFGYVAAPTVGIGATSGTAAGGTFTSVATTPTARVALYNLTLNYYAPATSAVVSPDDVVIPANRKLNNLSLAGNGNGLNLSGNLILFGTAPLTLTASLSTPGNILNLNGNTLRCTWNGYAGTAASTFNNAGTNTYVRNGTITLTGRGGPGTFNYPFAGNTTTGGLVWFVGSTPTAVTTGCNSLTYSITELGAPTGAGGTGAPMGTRSYRARLSAGAVSGLNPTVRLHFNSIDALTTPQNLTYIADAPSQSGPWTIKTAAYGTSGALPAAGSMISSGTAPGPIIASPDYYYAFAQIPCSVTSFTPSNSCGGGIVVITGTGFTGATSVTFGGTPALSFVVNSATQITAVVSNSGSTGNIVVTSPAGTGTSASTFTFNGVGPIVSMLPSLTPQICPGGTQVLTALPTGSGETYLWSTGDTTQAISVSPVSATSYTCTVTNSLGCSNPVTATVSINVPPAPVVTSTPAAVCAGDTAQVNANTFVSGTLSTPFDQNNGSSANGFDITNTSAFPVTLHFFSFQSSSAAGTVGTESIYYRTSSMACVFPANVTTAPGWTLIGSASTTSAGTALGTATTIPLDVNITIPAGATYAFAFGGALGVSYTNGVAGCGVRTLGTHMTVRSGFGGSLTGTIADRMWNGRVTYDYGDPALTYNWSPGGTLTSTSVVAPRAFPSSTTSYSVTVTNSLGCTGTATGTVNVNPVPSAPSVSGTLSVCGTSTTTLTATVGTPGDTLVWYNVPTGGTRIATGTTFTTPVISATTTYYVEEKNATCTSPRTPVTVVWTTPPTIAIYNGTYLDTNNVYFCGLTGIPVVSLNANSSFSSPLWAAHGSTYTWSEDHAGALGCVGTCTSTNTVDLNLILPGVTNDLITLTVSDPTTGCVATVSRSVSAFAFATFSANAIPPAVCSGSPSIVSSGVSASTFAVSSIPFAGMATPGSGVTTLASGGVATPALSVGSLDDGGWYNIPIGFNFNFFGKNYTSCHISTNGNIQFGYTPATTFSTSFTPGAVPSTTAPNNYVGLFWSDLYLTTTGTIRYWVTGSAPNRIFVVSYSNVPGFTTVGAQTGQIWLYETTGIVECHIALASDATHNKVCGVEDSTGTIGSAAPGRNSTPWTVSTPEAWRFTPPVNYTFSWTSSPSGFTSTNSSFTVSPTTTTSYYVLVTDPITLCTKSDTVTVTVNTVPTITLSPSRTFVCNPNGTAVTLNASGTGTSYKWSPPAGLSDTVGSSVTALPTSSTIYTVTSTLGTCTATANDTVDIRTGVLVTASASDTLICPNSNTNLVAVASAPSPSTYCQPVTSCTFPDEIANVTLATINRTSTCDGATTSGFSYYTSPSPTLNVGTSYPLSVTTDGDVEGVAVWIDYNKNGAFTPDELVTSGYLGTNPATYTATVNVPPTAINGLTRMRVRCTFNGNPITLLTVNPACDAATFGETEDYDVIIAGGVTPSYTYSWATNPTYLSSTSIANPSATSVATPQTYTVVASNSVGCSASATRAISLYTPPSVVTVTTNLSAACVGQGDTLTATGGTVTGGANNYTWSPALDLYTDPTFATPYVTGTLATTVYARPATSSNYVATSTSIVGGCQTNSTATPVIINAPGTGGCATPPRHDNMCYPVNVTSGVVTTMPYSLAGYANINTHTDTIYDNNTYATFQTGEPIGSCGSSGTNNKTLWYKFTAPFCSTPQVHISTDDRSTTNFNTRVSVYRRLAPFDCSATYVEVGCNDNGNYYLNSGSTTNSTIVLTPNSSTPGTNEYAPGEDLYIQASGFSSAYGNFGLIIDAEPYVPTVGSVGSGTAVVDWTPAMGMGGVSGTFIQWRPVGAAPTVGGTYAYIAGPSSTYTITGLLPGTNYEYWASYVCGNGGRWWSKKGTFTTLSSCVGTSPSIVSITAGTPCTQPVINFNATSLAYSSYRIVRRQVGSSTVFTSSAFYTSPTTQTYVSPPLSLGRTYQFYILAYCGTARVDSSTITPYTVCTSLRTANPNATEQVDVDKDVAYIMPNGTVVYGLPFNAMDLPIDVTNPNEQTFTLETMDMNTYMNNQETEEVIVSNIGGDMFIYPNPANTEATLNYSLGAESASMNIHVLDAQGKELVNDIIANPSLKGTYKINLNNFSAGVYFVKVQAGDFVQTKKLIVETK